MPCLYHGSRSACKMLAFFFQTWISLTVEVFSPQFMAMFRIINMDKPSNLRFFPLNVHTFYHTSVGSKPQQDIGTPAAWPRCNLPRASWKPQSLAVVCATSSAHGLPHSWPAHIGDPIRKYQLIPVVHCTLRCFDVGVRDLMGFTYLPIIKRHEHLTIIKWA